MSKIRRMHHRYQYALNTTYHRSSLLSALWAIGWVK